MVFIEIQTFQFHDIVLIALYSDCSVSHYVFKATQTFQFHNIVLIALNSDCSVSQYGWIAFKPNIYVS